MKGIEEIEKNLYSFIEGKLIFGLKKSKLRFFLMNSIIDRK